MPMKKAILPGPFLGARIPLLYMGQDVVEDPLEALRLRMGRRQQRPLGIRLVLERDVLLRARILDLRDRNQSAYKRGTPDLHALAFLRDHDRNRAGSEYCRRKGNG